MSWFDPPLDPPPGDPGTAPADPAPPPEGPAPPPPGPDAPPLVSVASVAAEAARIAGDIPDGLTMNQSKQRLAPDAPAWVDPWCAEQAGAIWAAAHANVDGLTAGADSFYGYGDRNHTLHNHDGDTPIPGDAVVYDYFPTGGWNNGPKASHVAIVVHVYDNGTMDVENGNFSGGHTELITNVPDHVGESVYGQKISAFVDPVPDGVPLQGPDYGVHIGDTQNPVAVAGASFHVGGHQVITGNDSIRVGPDQLPLAGHGHRTADNGFIQDRNPDGVWMPL